MARIGRFVYSFGGRAADGAHDGGTPRLVPLAGILQALDTETGSIELLQPASSDCAWPAPRASSSLAVWRDRFLVAFGGLVRTPSYAVH